LRQVGKKNREEALGGERDGNRPRLAKIAMVPLLRKKAHKELARCPKEKTKGKASVKARWKKKRSGNRLEAKAKVYRKKRALERSFH